MKTEERTIGERIAEVDLRPSDIVKLQVMSEGKPISLSQASGWIKNPTATKAIEQLLWRLCDEKVGTGLTFSKPGRKKGLVVAENFSGRLTVPADSNEYALLAGAAISGLAKEVPKKMDDVVEAFNAKNKKEFSRIASEKITTKTELDLKPVMPKKFKSVTVAQKIPAKNKNMKKENPYIEERIVSESPSIGSIVDFVKTASKMPPKNTEFHEVDGSIGDILPKLISATPTGFASWGTNGTMKLVGRVVKLNLNDLSYTVDIEKAKSGFLVEGKAHKLSDFTEVK